MIRLGIASVLLFAGAAQADPRGVEFFETKIRPVLVEHCYKCHSAATKKTRGSLALDTRTGVMAGGDTGPAIVSGKPAESLLIKALKHDGLKMPSESKKLPDAVVADFEAWIKMGAPDPRDGKAPMDVDKEARKAWAFQQPIRLPPTMEAGSEIDAFIFAGLGKLRPVRPAGKRELLRRATFGLIGLPPTPEEVERFKKDDAPDAWERVIDRLLSSPRYGERWGRHWLDVARYADDKALAFPTPWPHAYRYRDWVVLAMNRDVPYDRFLRLQLAGDLEKTEREDLAALGFQGLGAEYHKGSVPAQVKADELDDRIDTLSRGLLGLTVACARCHDHKYDPVSQKDYYSLLAAYNGASFETVALSPPDVVEKHREWDKKGKDLASRIAKATKEKSRDLAALKAEEARHKATAPPTPLLAHAVSGGGSGMRVNLRGNVNTLGESAAPGFLSILEPKKIERKRFTRLDLAEAVCSPTNPLTARVIVNRVWQQHFGRGIVATPSNFGTLGDKPTHPELLDSLAVRFMESGWSMKRLHREILLSATYRLSSANDTNSDPENAKLWRHTPRRLDIESWRDAVLAVSGRMDGTFGGAPTGLGEVGNARRTIYGKVSRLEPDKMLVAFDFPDANVSSERRAVTVVPQQQLFALNSGFMIASAKAFAARVRKAEAKDEERIALAHRLAFGRPATAAEVRLGLEFLREEVGAEDKLTAWEQYAQALLASNEFAWVD